MQLLYTERFRRSYADAPASIQKRCDKQLALLVRNLRHPSLRAKKYDEVRDIWQARVNGGWRLYFVIRGDLYYLLDMIPLPK
jgi:mRNA-degrading endonuclease RelE of RelBE toxin-antitoxin system